MSTITAPSPEHIIPFFATLPEGVRAAIVGLSQPFPIAEVKVRPGSVRRDGSAALCLAYADWWTGYLPRLNTALGPNNWTITLQPWGNDQIIARLTAFGGLITKESSGSAKGESNGAQEAEVQAKKRVCAEGLMLGLFFYSLPKVWGRGERVGKDFVFADGEEERCVHEMYRRTGLLATSISVMSTRATPERDVPATARPSTRLERAPSNGALTVAAEATPAPLAAKVAAARRALDQAERHSGLAPEHGASSARPAPDTTAHAPAATDPQLGLIAHLVTALVSEDEHSGNLARIDHIGRDFEVSNLSTLRTRQQLRSTGRALTKQLATRLIDALKALNTPTAPSA